MLNSEISFFIFVVVKNVKVIVPGGIETFIDLEGNEYKSFRKVLKALKSPSGGL